MKQAGFTLIELVIVIVILGVLAVTAAPRFIDLQGDARAATLEGIKAALQGGASLVHAKAAINGLPLTGDTEQVLNLSGTTVYIKNGYPAIRDVVSNLHAWADIDGSGSGSDTDWRIGVSTDSAPQATTATDEFAILPSGVTSGSLCKVIYKEAVGEGQPPNITVYSDDC